MKSQSSIGRMKVATAVLVLIAGASGCQQPTQVAAKSPTPVRVVDVALNSSDQTPWPQLTVNPDPLGDLTRKEGIDALRRAVLTLPRRYREVVVLCDLEEVDYADAARILGCPVGTVRSRMHRARALLMEKLAQERNPKPLLGTWKAAKCLT